MKRYIVIFSAIGLLLYAGQAGADPKTFTQNEFTTAESIDPGMTQTGIHFTLGDDHKSYYPAFRYGMGALFEIGVKFGVTTAEFGADDKVGGLVGADLKYQLIKETEGVPLDMAVDVGFDTTWVRSSNASELSFSTIFSRGFPLTERGYKFTPYGGLELAAEYGSYTNDRDTNFYVFGGFEWKISQKFMITMELKTGNTTLGGVGIKFEY
ncbi:MAG TPA: hypothetical protein VI956_12105 [Nitrospirota bacterium]|nr:hypothetical protein [Nitrospirota bacterium]